MKTFNKDEYNYEKSRPDYLKELFNDIFDYLAVKDQSFHHCFIFIGLSHHTLDVFRKKDNYVRDKKDKRK